MIKIVKGIDETAAEAIGINIKRAFQTVASAIWPSRGSESVPIAIEAEEDTNMERTEVEKNSEDNNHKNRKAKKPLQCFLAKTRTKHQNP